MKIILCSLLIFLILSGCEKSGSAVPGLQGSYEGIFTRTGMDTAVVSLTFSQNGFKGTSDKSNYPALCSGSAEREETNITFNDQCTWPANFDWSLILSGNYNVAETGNSIRIWKTNGNITDEYILTRKQLSSND